MLNINTGIEYLVTFKAMRPDGSVSVTVYGWALKGYLERYADEVASVTAA
jgi:hypothetical protein